MKARISKAGKAREEKRDISMARISALRRQLDEQRVIGDKTMTTLLLAALEREIQQYERIRLEQ